MSNKTLTQKTQALSDGNRINVVNKSMAHKLRTGFNVAFVTALTIALLVIFLAPFLFMIFTSLKTQGQISQIGAPIWPAKPPTYEYNGKAVEIFKVPMSKCAGADPNDASIKDLAVVKKGRQSSTFVDPNNLAAGEFACQVSWRALKRPWIFSPTWSNYAQVWDTIDYPRLMWNTTFYA